MTNRNYIAVVLYVSQHKGKASIILVNDSPIGEVLYKENILDYAIPVQQEKFFDIKKSRPSRLSFDKRHFPPE